MNYRHAFHAGGIADCFKHALLIWLVRALQRKPGALFVLDTHAGAGRYDLDGPEASRTGEWRAGILRLRGDPPPMLADYVALAGSGGTFYPGSPALVRMLLRSQDRLACCELHPEDHAALRALFAGDRQVAVHRRDGWAALGALLPPAEKRGLVLIDPPYEQPDELTLLATGLFTAATRFGTGVIAAWVPVKGMAPVRALRTAIGGAGLCDVVAAMLVLRAPLDAARLNGSMLLVARPPYGFEDAAAGIGAALLERLGEGERGADVTVERWAAE